MCVKGRAESRHGTEFLIKVNLQFSGFWSHWTDEKFNVRRGHLLMMVMRRIKFYFW